MFSVFKQLSYGWLAVSVKAHANLHKRAVFVVKKPHRFIAKDIIRKSSRLLKSRCKIIVE